MEKWDVVGIGSVSVDFVGTLAEWPAPGQKIPLESLHVADGGLIATALCGVTRLGGRARFIGNLGTSEVALRAISALVSEGIDTSLVVRGDPLAQPHLAMVLTLANGQRTIFYSRDNVRYPSPQELGTIKWWEGVRVFLFDGGSGASGVAFARLAQGHGLTTVIDAEREKDGIQEALDAADHIVVPEDFAKARSGSDDPALAASRLRTRKGQTVVVTRGDQGCVALAPDGEEVVLPAFEVPAVDTTGCGDVFHGAYCLAVSRKASLKGACLLASSAAALAATKVGGRGGIPRWETLRSFLADRGIDTRIFAGGRLGC